MSLRTSIHATLLAAGDVTALIGAGALCRHYPGRVPHNPDYPFVVSSEIASDAQETHGTATDAEDTLDETLMQFSCYAPTLAVALAVRAAVRAAFLDDDSAILATAHIVVTSPQTRELYEDAADLHCAQLDLTFFHNPQT